MGRLAGFSLHDDQYRPLDEMLAEIDAVTPEEVAAVAAEFFAPERQTVVTAGTDACHERAEPADPSLLKTPHTPIEAP